MASTAFAQPLPILEDPAVDLNTGWGNRITATGVFDYNANTVRNELPLALYQGGYLERDLRQRSLDALSSGRNASGYLLEGRLDWIGPACFAKAPGWRPIARIAHHEVGGLRFTKDQYALTFFGNASFEGERAVLAPSAFTRIRYQTAGTGMQHAASGSFVRVDLVRGQSYSGVDIRWASLFTGDDGRVLRTTVLGNYFATDTAGSGIERTNGAGAAISGRWNTGIQLAGRKALFAITLDDLGLVRWNNNSVRIEKDTVIIFSGLEVENLFALDNVLVGEDQLLDTFGLRYGTGAFTRALPFRVGIETTMMLGQCWHIGLAADQRYIPGYVPLVTAMASRRFGSRTLLGTAVSYGGFGGLRVGISAKHRFGEHVLVSLSTPQLPAFFSGSVRGAGALASVSLAF